MNTECYVSDFGEDGFFNDYIVEEENKAACLAVLCAITNMGEIYNPLFISAESGNGKSTLMELAFKWANEHEYRGKIMSATELQELICKILFMKRENPEIGLITEIHKEFTDADFVVIENLESLKDLFATMETVFDIIDVFVKEGKQVFITSTMKLDEYDAYCTRLRIMKWNKAVEINIPELSNEFKFKLVRKLQKNFGLFLNIIEISMIVASTRSIGHILFILNQIKEVRECMGCTTQEAVKRVITKYL